MNKYLIMIILFLSSVCFCYANDMLNIPVGARPVGMGNAYVSLAEDIYSLPVNPAGLSGIHSLEILTSHQILWEEMSFEYIAAGKALFGGGLSAGIGYLNTPAVTHYDDWGLDLGEIDLKNYFISLGFGRDIYDFQQGRFAAGLGVKMVNTDIDVHSTGTSASGIGLDAGVIFNLKTNPQEIRNARFLKGVKFIEKGVNIGLSVQNVGVSAKEGYEFPLTIRFGVSSEIYKNFILAVDMNKVKNVDMRYNLGAEYVIMNLVALRTGYQINYDVQSITAGAGLRYGFGQNKNSMILLDYAFVPYQYGEYNHNISLSFRSGK